MAKPWHETEDGREAVLEMAQLPNALAAIRSIGEEHIAVATEQILSAKVLDPAEDRRLVVNKAELDGAKKMLKFILQTVERSTERKED